MVAGHNILIIAQKYTLFHIKVKKNIGIRLNWFELQLSVTDINPMDLTLDPK